MGTESDPSSRTELIVKAWELSTQRGLSTRAVARELGIPHSTAAGYIRQGSAAEGMIDLLDRGEARLAQAVRLAGYLDRLEEVMKDDPSKTLEVIAGIRWIEDRWAKLVGTDMPVRTQNEIVPGQVEPDPEIAAAIREAAMKAAVERRGLRGDDK